MVEHLTVKLGERSYPIHFGKDMVEPVRETLGKLAAKGRKVAVLTDRKVAATLAESLRDMFGPVPMLAVEPGEGAKSMAVFGQVLEFMAEHRLDRDSVLFAFGGGVIGDLGGFAAASYLRGIDFFQIPTTLLAMVDSSVGGKTGINLKAGKNLAGAFHQPRGVFIATGMLDSLPSREFAAGMAEVIKYGLLGDAELFNRLEREPLTKNSADLSGVIRECCAQKARIVEADERETARAGGRALLNLGHTFGHAIEQVTGYGAYLHGEAVAIGLGAAAHLSQKLGFLDAATMARIEAVVGAHGLPLCLREPLPVSALMSAVTRDKKVRAGVLRFVLLRRIGEAVTGDRVEAADAEACFRAAGAVD